MTKFTDQYKDSRWQKKRLEIMERDNFTCRSCGKSEGVTLNVHHAYYEKGMKVWEYPNYALITWCEKCHELRHRLQLEAFETLSELGRSIDINDEALALLVNAINISYNNGLEDCNE